MTTQPTKKATSASAAAPGTAKLASAVANKTARTTFAAVESTRSSAENVVKIGANAVKDLLSSSADEAQKAQEKVFAIGRESAENFAKSADAVSKMLYESIALSRDNVEACVECGNMAAALAKSVSEECFEYANRSFSENMEASKEAFGCRTINDMVELQNQIIKRSFDGFFAESMKLSELIFEFATEVLEPINERVSRATEQFGKAFVA